MERRGGETKILKSGSKLGQGVVALKGGTYKYICRTYSRTSLGAIITLNLVP